MAFQRTNLEIQETTETTNVVTPKNGFGLENSPNAYIISVHVQNMMATMGEQYVRDVITELFLKEVKPTKKRKVANG